MTPAARAAAAIDILDRIDSGTPVGQALTNWARGNRYAGSGDRAAIRDHIFGVIRQKNAAAAAGGGHNGRALLLGYLRLNGVDPETVFTGATYAPPCLSAAEQAFHSDPAGWPDPVRLDYPGWLDGALRAALGDGFEANMQALRHRAPVFLRVNKRRANPGEAARALAAEGIATRPAGPGKYALEVTQNARRVAGSAAYRDGLVEVQDAASQAVVEALPLPAKGRILDYCAGGGGKALAMAALSDATIFAHDISAARMQDLPARAARAKVAIAPLKTAELATRAPYDMVFCDVPCSGSGAWRRAPAGKWALDAGRLRELCALQAEILAAAAPLVAPGGWLVYATCSVLRCENADRIAAFCDENNAFSMANQASFMPADGGDGMFVSCLMRES